MNIIDDAPFYIVIIGVLLNVIIGLKQGIGFTELMIRSIVVTIICSIVGFLISDGIGGSIKESRKKKAEAERQQSRSFDTAASNNAKPSSNIDISVPPMNEDEYLNYGLDDEENESEDDEFTEINPAYLHKNSQREQNE